MLSLGSSGPDEDISTIFASGDIINYYSFIFPGAYQLDPERHSKNSDDDKLFFRRYGWQIHMLMFGCKYGGYFLICRFLSVNPSLSSYGNVVRLI